MPIQTSSAGGRRIRWRLAAAASAAVLIGTGGGFAISDAVVAGSPPYVTAVVTTAGVSRTLPLTGVVQPVSEVHADFQVSGTVSAVDTSVGEQVTAGQKLASIEGSALQMDVDEQQAVLTAAEAKLTADEEDEAASGGTGSSGAGSDVSSSVDTADAQTSSGAPKESGIVLTSVTVPSRNGGAGHGSGGGSVEADQQAVVTGQHQLDLDMQTSAAAFRQAEVACGVGPPGQGGHPTTTTSTTTTTTTSTRPTATTPPSAAATSTTPPSTSATRLGGGTGSSGGTGSGAGSATDAACVAALGQAEQAAMKVDTAEQVLAGAESSLAQALAKESSSIATSPTHSISRATVGSAGSFASSKTGQQPSSRSTTVDTDTPEQLASDEATIDLDEANLVVAQQNLADSVLDAPITGEVAAVGLTAGQMVSAGSSTDSVTIIAAGTYEVQATLTTAQVSQVADGDAARVTVNGMGGTYQGKVSRIGPVVESDSTFSYPLVVALRADGVQFPAGADAQLTVDLQSVGAAVVVPTSAVHTEGPVDYVLVLKGGSDVEQRVTVGVVGTVYTQVTAGLSKGTVVILADRAAPVPSSNTQTTSGAGFAGGGAFRAFGGAGAGGGGGFAGFAGRGGGAGSAGG